MINGLIREQTIFLKSSIHRKAWFVQFLLRESEGQLCAGWIDFARENGLKEGDQCTFRHTAKNTLHVNIVRKYQKEVIYQIFMSNKTSLIS
jgi:B3 DNA binding domain